MRLSAASLDINAFRGFLEAAGCDMLEAHGPAGELLRFRFGLSYGAVSRRKNGSLTLSGEASQHFINFRKAMTVAPAGDPTSVPRIAKITTLTIPVEQHAAARERLAPATKAIVYTDGSAERGGRGHGGWAAIIRAGFDIVEIHGGAKASTVNRMEIIAAVVALEILPAGCAITLHTDSKYLRNGITKWIDNWKRYGWKTSLREPVKNDDLWRRLDAARDQHNVKWKWVKAHAGIRLNERADELAKFARHSITKGF